MRHLKSTAWAVWILAAVFVLSGCGTTLIATGEGLDIMGQQFLAAGKVYDGMYDAKTITEAQYAPWRTFALEFKAYYVPAVATWRAAKAGGDHNMAGVIEQGLAAYRGKMADLVKAISPQGSGVFGSLWAGVLNLFTSTPTPAVAK